MKIRPFNIDKMRRHVARSTPDRVQFVVSMKELHRIGETGVRRLFINWMDKMRVKHLGKRKRIEFFQEYNISDDSYWVTGVVVDDPYARPIQSTRSQL
jgi:hypothetical protein